MTCSVIIWKHHSQLCRVGQAVNELVWHLSQLLLSNDQAATHNSQILCSVGISALAHQTAYIVENTFLVGFERLPVIE